MCGLSKLVSPLEWANCLEPVDPTSALSFIPVHINSLCSLSALWNWTHAWNFLLWLTIVHVLAYTYSLSCSLLALLLQVSCNKEQQSTVLTFCTEHSSDLLHNMSFLSIMWKSLSNPASKQGLGTRLATTVLNVAVLIICVSSYQSLGMSQLSRTSGPD